MFNNLGACLGFLGHAAHDIFVYNPCKYWALEADFMVRARITSGFLPFALRVVAIATIKIVPDNFIEPGVGSNPGTLEVLNKRLFSP